MAETTCAVDGCDNNPITRGWCPKHYQRWRAHGDVGSDGPRSCSDCDGEFLPANARQGRCSSCRRLRHRPGKHRLLGYRDCEWCGKTFEVRTDNPESRGCSRLCGTRLSKSVGRTSPLVFVQCNWCEAWRTSRTPHDCTEKPGPAPPVACRVCGTQIAGAPRHQRYCSSICKGIANYGSSRRIWIVDCAWCDTTYISRLEHGAYCSKRCNRHSRRHLEGRFVVPDTLRFAIYERDRWVCQLCGRRVGRSYPANHRRAPSLDHIIPRSLGGSDEPDNLQLSHRLCNSLKSDGTYAAADQLTLSASTGV